MQTQPLDLKVFVLRFSTGQTAQDLHYFFVN
jgi:hypothetical protein